MYVDALFDRNNEIIKVVERINGERHFKEFKPNWDFYIPDLAGTYTSIFGDRLKKLSPKNKSDRAKLFRMYPVTFEADIDPMLRLLEMEYGDKEPPTLNIAFFDIETAFDTERGYASPEDPFNPITSIAVYLQWCETMVCLAVPPKTLTFEQAESIAEQVGNTIICKTEAQMLDMFMTLIEDADVISGWNSSFFDIPYTVGRIIRQIDKHETRRLCLWNEMPKPKMISRGSKESLTYTLAGRIHLDYMELYKEYNYEERQSYSLDNIAEAELGERKVEYSGTLHQLYNNDFKLFLEYNIQDTMLLDKLDKKLQYIDLANTIAHDTCVPIPAAMGTVTKIDNAIVMEAHRRGMIVPNKRKITGDTRAAGGWVSKPKKGLHKWVGSSDLNSLYPSVIRAFNMSLETVVGQVDLSESVSEMNKYINAAPSHNFARYWNDRFCPPEMEPFFANDLNKSVYIKFDSGESEKLSIASLKSIIKDPAYPWVISANGTLFRTDKIGVIPSLLTKWYNERKVLQKYEKSYKRLFDNEDKGISISNDLLDLSLAKDVAVLNPKTPEGAVNLSDLEKIIESGDKQEIAKYLVSHNLKVNSNGKVIFGDQKELKNIIGYWYKRQLVRKLALNSTFGCVLNEASRFFDQRIGQSITLSGRNITRHMAAKTNEMLCGEYDHYGKCIVYGDTDSVVGDTVIRTSKGNFTIEDLYEKHCNDYSRIDDKEFGYNDDLMVMSYDPTINQPYMGHINYIYRHKVEKDLYKVTDSTGKVVVVTEDHSIMVRRGQEIIEVKPYELKSDDILITINVESYGET